MTDKGRQTKRERDGERGRRKHREWEREGSVAVPPLWVMKWKGSSSTQRIRFSQQGEATN